MDNKLASSVENKTWGLAGTILWSAVIGICYVFSQLMVLYGFVSIKYGAVTAEAYEKRMADLQYNGLVLSLCLFASLVVCVSVMLLAIKLKKQADARSYLALNTVDGRTAMRWLGILAVFIVASDGLTVLLGKPVVPEFMQQVYQSTTTHWFLWLALVLAAPLMEELFFRGFVITGLQSTVLRPAGAVLVSAAFWALLHLQYDAYGILTIFVMGILLGAARIKSNSVLLTIGLHGFANLVAMVEASAGLY